MSPEQAPSAWAESARAMGRGLRRGALVVGSLIGFVALFALFYGPLFLARHVPEFWSGFILGAWISIIVVGVAVVVRDERRERRTKQ